MYDSTNMAHNGTNAQTYNNRQIIVESNEFLSYDVQLASFGGKAASGNHSFPFSVKLPSSLPPSMEVRLNDSWHSISFLYCGVVVFFTSCVSDGRPGSSGNEP